MISKRRKTILIALTAFVALGFLLMNKGLNLAQSKLINPSMLIQSFEKFTGKSLDQPKATTQPSNSPQDSEQCEWFEKISSSLTDIKMSDLLDQLPFDTESYLNHSKVRHRPNSTLRVVILPHSHTDPGWLKTYDEYYDELSKKILTTIVDSLSEKPTRKFIWTETSFLALWWRDANKKMRDKMRRLIVDTKQLEITTGGWVMTDEANSHYFAMIDQMIEGHEWLRTSIDPSLRPVYSWSNDPFGYSPTQTYLLKQSGFKSMFIHRVHYHLKQHFNQIDAFEFDWMQSWDTNKETSMFCHVMPYVHYDILNTCGPNPGICCQFDFKRLGGVYGCPGPWPTVIDSTNVEQKADMLLKQYKSKANLYEHNVVLIELGDDFRFTDMQEAHAQFENYERLIDYINANEEKFGAHVEFGTLKDYFELVDKERSNVRFKTLSGDFFPYTDRGDQYWTGYFTSRPFNKRLSRRVEHYLRSSEILFSISHLTNSNEDGELFTKLIEARRNLGLFQHHDAITGTSKKRVVVDYTEKLYTAFRNSKEIIETALSSLHKEKGSKEADMFISISSFFI